MTTDQEINKTKPKAPLPTIRVPQPSNKADIVTILGLISSVGIIIIAIILGQSDANFFNLPSFLIVIVGTLTATSISYSGRELKKSLQSLRSCLFRPVRNFALLAKSMIDFASIARTRGVLQLSNYEKETQKEPFLNKGIRMVVDGYQPDNIKRILQQDIDMQEERGRRAAGILRRASEVAPAMGLIGTLVGLVQMLADLQNPDAIGPAMAVALLTTFYGAILGTIIMAPLAAKLEKNTGDEKIAQTMVLKTCISILEKENPRNLEMMINSLLPPSERIVYFKE